jgi:gliding motility-associated-like protein
MKALLITTISLLFAFSFSTKAQNTTVNHLANFNSGQQNMWGPSFSPITLDQTITLFDESWNVNFNTGSSGIFTIAGQSFGGALSGSFSGRIGSEIRIEGFTSGTVEIDYPVDIELIYPQNSTYDQGEDVTIQTDYTVRSGYNMETLYPSAGEFFWDFYFQMGASASAQLCFFGCTTFPIIPSFNTGLQTLNLVTVSSNGVSTNGNLGVWFLGPGEFPPYVGGSNPDPLYPGTEPPVGGWAYAVPVETSPTTSPVPNFIPWQCYIGPGFPAEIPGGFGLSGEITIPYVPDVTDNLSGTNLSSCNDSTYFNLNLEIFQLLGGILSNVPGPVGVFGQVIANLSGSQDLGIAEITWNFFSASFDANITNRQCFDFTPSVYGRFEFPVAVDYSITDMSGTTSAVQQGSIINIEIGEDINYKFPCYFEDMDITPTYSIDGRFRNHTYDSVSFDFLMSAFAFGFEVPAVTIIPGFTIPEICIPIPYPCPSWSCPWCWCSYTACTPEIVVPPIGFSGWSLEVGPLWETSIPLGGFTYDWFDQTWNLEGFEDTTFVPFTMTANQLTIDAIANDVDCWGGNDGTVEVNIGAVTDATPYSYSWTNGTTSSGGNSTTLIGLTAGAYQVTVVDDNDCQLFSGATVQEPSKLTVNYVKQNKSCAGSTNDGSIDVTVTGGTGSYTYNWSNGSTTQDINSLDAGTYSLTVTDGNGCQETISVIIDVPFALTHSAIVTDVNCNSESTGSIDVSAVGGTLPYAFNWSSGQSTEDISNLSAGSYTFTVTDQNGCTSSGTYAISEPSQPLTLSETHLNVSCFDGNDGSINLTVTGGTGTYSYQWLGDTQGQLAFNGEDPLGLIADNYTVAVVDQNGCSSTIVITITEPNAPLASTEVITDVNCFGDVTGEIDPQISGGTPVYTYNWSNGSSAPVLSNLAAGNYSLTVTDDQGCIATFNYTIEEPIRPVTIVTTKTDVLCFGEDTGVINALVTGGTTPYNYSWTNGEATADIDSLVAGTYTLTVTDALGCTETASETIVEPAAPVALSSAVQDVLCHGGNDGSIDLTVSGGTNPYSYEWSNGSAFIYSDTTQDLSNLVADQYLVTVTDANGCTDTLTSVIDEPSAPLSLVYTPTSVDCFGAATGAIDITVSGGTAGYNYSWSNGDITEDLTGITAGDYTITVTDQNGCDIQTVISVSEPVSALAVSTVARDVSCFGSTTGSIEANVTGGTTPYSYSWSNGETQEDIDSLGAGTYTLTVTDANGCTAFTGATINQPSELDVIINITDPSCYGYSNGQVVLDITGGIQPYYFNWGNQNDILLNNPSETIDSIVTGEYLVRVTDENGCVFEELIFVDEPSPFEFQAVVDDVTCFEGADGAIDLTLTGGTTPYTVDWNNGLTGEDIAGLTSDNYSFLATDDQGCIIRSSLFVDQPDEIGITYDMVPVSCVDQSDAAIFISTYGGTAPYTYDWSNNTFGQNLEDVGPGFYELIVTDVNNCSNNFEFDIISSEEECLVIPNTFTPNGDLYNDTWVLENLHLYPNNTVKIFNKWGNEIFSSQGEYDPWDGTHNGKALPAGVYYYIIILSNEEVNKYTGNITIVR